VGLSFGAQPKSKPIWRAWRGDAIHPTGRHGRSGTEATMSAIVRAAIPVDKIVV
jgi:hypothetical protein